MKKVTKLFVLFFMAIAMVCQSAHAHDPFVKLGRGIVNIVTAPAEFATQTMIVGEKNNAFVTLLSGTIMRGTLYTGVRVLAGVYEVVTFLIPIPSDYGPIMEPETGLEALHEVNGASSYVN